MVTPSLPVLSVTGLGYVGLPVAAAFTAAGIKVIGYDHNPHHIRHLQTTTRYAGVEDHAIRHIYCTSDGTARRDATFHIVTVPTPVDSTRKPDLTLLKNACTELGAILKPGDTVVFESTVYPGATREVCIPLLEQASALKAGQDFSVGYSPERINPGDSVHRLEQVTKIIAGLTPGITHAIAAVYNHILKVPPYLAPSVEVAEAAKVLENTQRDINIALMNEMAMIFHRLGLDTNDVIDAAASKWNFHPYRPGLVGGHCIGVDPYYLLHKAETHGYTPETIVAGRRINNAMGKQVADAVIRWLLRQRCPDPAVIILGLTFKEDIDDVRNTRVTDIYEALTDCGIRVLVHDPHASPTAAQEHCNIPLTPLESLPRADAVVLAVAHREYREKGWTLPVSLLHDKGGMVADVKATLPRAEKPESVTLWRL